MGQELATIYSFLSTLFEETTFDVPFVIDSPCGKMDSDVRDQVGQMIPEFFEQIVIFIINTEKEGFVDGLETHKETKKQYITVRAIMLYIHKIYCIYTIYLVHIQHI